MTAIEDARAALNDAAQAKALRVIPAPDRLVSALRALIAEHERLNAPTIPYETEEGVVIAVDLDGTVHRARPAPRKVQ